MTTDSVSLTDPLPLFHHVASGRVFYIAAGACPLVFSVCLEDVCRNAPVVDRGAEDRRATHPFGQSTKVASLALTTTRHELAEATLLESSALDRRLYSWATFCDEVADRLNEGEAINKVLSETWVFSEGQDVSVDDDEPAVPAGSLQ